jgi:hypothetical protein
MNLFVRWCHRLLLLAFLAPLLARADRVLINEFMYQPASLSTNEEWIELWNAGTNAVNLQGWRLTRGVDFTFNNAYTLAPGAFVVVTANSNVFAANHPAVAASGIVFGDWSGTLRNSGDTIRLEDAAGNKADEVTYADQGDWAFRIRGPLDRNHRGWDWFAPHNGTGLTLELVNPDLPNSSGQNWSASAVFRGTPGAANSTFNTNTAPLILDVAHFPLVPRSTNSVFVSARIVDPQGTNTAVKLFHRLDANPQFNPFTATTMFDDGAHGDGLPGDGVYGAAIAPQADRTIVEFYVEAAGVTGRTNSWPAPAIAAFDGAGPTGQVANALFQFDNTVYAGGQPLYRLLMTEAERVERTIISNVDSSSDAAMNATFISLEGSGSELRYLCSMRARGAGSRTSSAGRAVPNQRVNIPSDRRWKGVTQFNLNSLYTHAQLAGYAMASRAGLNTESARIVQVRINSTNNANAGLPQYGSYIHLETVNADFVDAHFPLDNGGNAYRASDFSHRADLSFKGTNYTSYSTTGYQKQNNTSENDWSDLIGLTDVLNNTPDSNYVQAVRQVANVEEWMLYFAVFALLESEETSLATGAGDDYSMYRGSTDPRFLLIAHDWDTILGQGDAGGSTNRNFFRMTNVAAVARFIKHPEFAPVYYATLLRLLDTSFSSEQGSRVLDEVLGPWVPAGTVTAMKTFATNRNSWVRGQIPRAATANSGLSTVSGFPWTNAPEVLLWGRSDAVNTRTVLVNGSTSIWSAWEARWTNTVSLVPGINRVIVQGLDANGIEVTRTNYDIWYDTGANTPVSGAIAANTTWTPAGGPYFVTANLTVSPGATLTIQPGTTVFVGAGVSITVNGRLLAGGTDLARIRFTRLPGGANWGSLDFINTGTNESRVAYADFDSCAGTDIGGHSAQLHANNSRVFIDHCTWPPTPAVQYISFDASSFVVQSCVFPTYPWATSAPEMLHGVNGIPAGGHGIFRDNYFGHTYGFNDTIDFTGGQRPGPILQIIGNVFDGAGDDHLDLDSTDAWIEGNVFMHAHRDPNRVDDPLDTASAISGGVDVAGQYSEWTIFNNLFYNVDHAVLVKQGNRFSFINNTLVHVAKENGSGQTNDIAAFNFTDKGLALPAAAIGAGAIIAGNVIWDTPALLANYNAANHTVIFTNNVLPTNWTGPGGANVVADPRLNLQLITTISNATAQAVRAAFAPRTGSPVLGAGIGAKYDAGGLNPKGLMIFGEPPAETSATTATLTVASGGIFNWGTNAYLWGYTHYRWKLDNGPWSAELPISTQPTISLSGLSTGPHTVYVSGRNDAGYYQDDTFVHPTNSSVAAHVTASRTWMVTNAPGRVILSEVLAHNTGGVEVGGSTPDLIELFNPGSSSVDLGGVGVTDDPALPYKFQFAPGTTLAAGQRLVLQADSGKETNYQHIGFSLNQSGDGVYLHRSLASGGGLLDSVEFGVQLENLTIARMADGSWQLAVPTFGAANIATASGEPSRLRINEWFTDQIFGNDFIELFNTDVLPVDLGGCYVTDTPASGEMLHEVTPLTFVAAGGFFLFVADGDTGQGSDHLSFKLSPDRGEIALFSPEVHLIDCILYHPQTTDTSEGRTPDGSSARAVFNTPTPGAPNPGQGNVAIVISNFFAPVFNITGKSWKYDASSNDLGTAWRAVGYNDAAWSGGTGLFGFESTSNQYAPYSFTTYVPSPSRGGPVTVYYRTHFNWTNGAGWTLVLTNYADDGAVFYLNGTELGRIRVTSNPVLFTSQAQNSTEPSIDILNFAGTSLVNGDNVLAVELHQSDTNSSDHVFGLGLAATKAITNILQIAVTVNEIMANNRSYTNADGTVTDWVELYNPGGATADLGDMSLSDDVATPRRWVFPSGITIAPGAHLVVKFDPGSPASSNAAPLMNTGFGFDAGGDRVLLFDKLARGGSLVDSVNFGLQAADFSIGRITNGIGSWTLTLPTEGGANIAAVQAAVTSLRINEWMADPRSGDDWFELFNSAAQPVALGGLYLTDDLNNRTQYRIPNLSYVAAGLRGFVQFLADSTPSKGADHTNFKLSGGGESIGLFAADGLTAIDTVTFAAQQLGVSEGRFPDGATNIVRFPGTATPGGANYLPITEIRINEAITHTDLPLEDAIELFNASASPINIGGWFLSDTPSDPKRFRIPDNTILQAGGFAVFYENQFNSTPGFSPSFSLSSGEGDQIHLSAADAFGNLTGYRVTEDFGAQVNGVSFGAHETSVGYNFVAMTARSLGVDNPGTVAQFRSGTGLVNPAPVVGPVVVNEVHYHPPDIGTNDNTLDEFIELYNTASTNVALFDPANPTNTWHLRNAVDFNFPTNVTMTPRSYLLVVGFDPATNAAQVTSFRSRYGVGGGVPILGPLTGKLANDGDNIELRRPDQPNLGDVPYVLVERVRYSDLAPWPSAADGNTNGNGISLQRIVPAAYGNDPVNWLAGLPTAGATNNPSIGARPAFAAQPTNQTVAPGATVVFSAAATGVPALHYQWRFNGLDIAGATNASLTVTNAQFAETGNYSVRVANLYGAAVSANALLALAAPPEIVFQPQSVAGTVGATASFTVAARGATPLAYQWRKDGTNIAGATQIALTLTNVQFTNQGAYTVVVTNGFGATTSAVAFLQFNSAPIFITQPQGTNVIVGQTAQFSVAAFGSLPLRYQWRFNGVAIGGATNFALTLTNVQLAQAGNYSVVITNIFGSVTSSNATLGVVALATVTIAAVDSTAAEAGFDTGQFVITRSGVTTLALAVHFTIGGTAGNGSDYQAVSSPAVIPAGAGSVNVNIVPSNDAAPEAAETVVLTLASAAEYVVGGAGTATVTIADDDNLAPSVTLTAPANNAYFPVSPTNILIAATADDPDGTVSKVEFFNHGTNKLGEVAGPGPFNLPWNAATGTNVLTAVATDNFGRTTVSAPVTNIVNGPPVVAITSPAHGGFVPVGNVTVSASASSPAANITRVTIYVDGVALGTVSNAPYSLVFSNATLGAHQAFAVAWDSVGLVATSGVAGFTLITANTNMGDMFTNRGFVVAMTNVLTASNTGATRETNEPVHVAGAGGRTMWISWIAPAAGFVSVDTFFSSFDTVLAVYTNAPGTVAAVSNLVMVGWNDDASNVQSRVVFTNRVAGTMYHVVVDGYSTANGTIRLTIQMSNQAPVIVTQPAGRTNSAGSSATFSVAATGAPPLSYRWRFNGAVLPGATNASLLLTNVQSTNGGAYTVVVSNYAGSVTSAVALLAVRAAPVILSQPAGQLVALGAAAGFNVTASGDALSYQWRFNAANIPGATASSFVRPNVGAGDAGTYTVVITNAAGAVTSAPAVLSIISPPALTGLRRTGNVFSGTLSGGTSNLGYYIEVTTNFDAWSVIRAVTNVNGQAPFADTNGSPRRIYRARLMP